MSYIGKEIRRQPLVITGSDSSTFLKVEQKDSGSTAIQTNNIQTRHKFQKKISFTAPFQKRESSFISQ